MLHLKIGIILFYINDLYQVIICNKRKNEIYDIKRQQYSVLAKKNSLFESQTGSFELKIAKISKKTYY